MAVRLLFARFGAHVWRNKTLGIMAFWGALLLLGCSSNETAPAQRLASSDSVVPTTRAAPAPSEATTSSTTTVTTSTSSTTTTIPEFDEVIVAAPGSEATSTDSNVVFGVDAALDILAPGGTIVLGPGVHPPIHLDGVAGDPTRPLRIVGAEGAVVRGESHSADAALLITGSTHLEIRDVRAEHALWGIMVESSQNIEIVQNVIQDIGQEAIRVRDGSSHIQIIENTISNTGRRTDIASPNGEGIYIGTGTPSGVDVVTEIDILRNNIFGVADEAIDIKLAVSDVRIADNRISDVATATSGAIVIHLNAPPNAVDPNIILERNIIRDVTRTSPYLDGNCIVAATTVTIVNNIIHGCEHRGIYLRGEGGIATILHNTLIDTGTEGALVDEFPSSTVVSQNNLGLSGEENHAPVSVDDLADPSTENYRPLSETSIPSTTPSVGVVDDFVGSERPSDLVTFGAVEQ